MAHLTQRKLIPKLMDDPAADRSELARAMAYLRGMNLRSGRTRALVSYLQRQAPGWPKDQPIRLIDVGTGSADIPLAAVNWAKQTGHELHVTGIDVHATILDIAREFIGDQIKIKLVTANALRLMDHFEPGSFDYAHAGMFLHHLCDIEVMTVLRIMDRLSTRAVIWNDQLRGVAGQIGVRLLTLGAPKMVKHDEVVSVAMGFTRREAIALARRADLKKLTYRSHLLQRFTLISEKT